MTFGWGVEDDQSYPAILEQKLNEEAHRIKDYNRVEVINAGFTDGFTLDSYYLYYKEIAGKFKPDLVILNFFPYNDIAELMDSTWEKVDSENLPTKIVSSTHRAENGYIVSRKKTNWKFEIPILRNYHLGIMFLNALEKGAPDLVNKIKKLVQVSDLKEEIDQNTRSNCVYTVIQKNCPERLWLNFDKAKLLLSRIKELAKQNKQSLIVTIMASPDQAVPLSTKPDRSSQIETAQPQKYFRDFFKEQGIIFDDLLPVLTPQSKAEQLFFKQDGHLTREGNQEVAAAILKFLEQNKNNY